jgi:hypothetical protein
MFKYSKKKAIRVNSLAENLALQHRSFVTAEAAIVEHDKQMVYANMSWETKHQNSAAGTVSAVHVSLVQEISDALQLPLFQRTELLKVFSWYRDNKMQACVRPPSNQHRNGPSVSLASFRGAGFACFTSPVPVL